MSSKWDTEQNVTEQAFDLLYISSASVEWFVTVQKKLKNKNNFLFMPLVLHESPQQ